MGAGTSLFLSLVVALLIGGAGTLYFRTVVMRHDETAAGLAALSAMSWREFIQLVLDALADRGYTRVFDREAPSGDDDYTLERDDRHWLLSCKHGSAFVLGNAAVTELAGAIRMANAAGGILATQGSIAAVARPPAALQKIELLDGPTLWPELRNRIPEAQRTVIRTNAATRARQRTLLSWLLALIAGVACFLLLHASGGDTLADGKQLSIGAVKEMPAGRKVVVPAISSARRDSGPAADSAAVAAPAANDTAALAAQRDAVAKAASTLPMVAGAAWTTSSTLEVKLSSTDGDAFASVCPILVRYEALAASRVQLTPPEGSTASVRFRQCRQY